MLNCMVLKILQQSQQLHSYFNGQWVGRFSVPSQIRSEKSSQFINAIIAEFLDMFDTEHDFILAYSKHDNTLVENANKEENNHLRAIIYSMGIKSK